MKSPKLLVLGLLWSSYAIAADVVPTQFKAFETDLARPELQLKDDYSYRLGINFVEGHKYVLHPAGEKLEKASSIRREINLSLRLPYKLETGLALYDSQQATSDQLTAVYGNVKHKSQHLGGALWARYHLIQSEKLSSSIVLQYEAGSADKASFHQASQDKTGLAIHVDGSPIAYTEVGAYLGLTRRQDESFRVSRLNDEMVYGARLSVGPEAVKAFAETQIRDLPWKSANQKTDTVTSRQYEIGLSGQYRDLRMQASSFVPTSSRFVGVPERGFKIAVQMMLGKTASTASKELEPEVKAPLAPMDKAPINPKEEPAPATTESIDNFDSIKSDVKEEGLGAIPVFKDELEKSKDDKKAAETLTLPGADEFQKFEEQQTVESKSPESATEKAERAYQAQIENDKKLKSAKAEQEISSADAERARLLKEIEAEEREIHGSAQDIEKELKQYTLPDNDDVNWTGLSK